MTAIPTRSSGLDAGANDYVTKPFKFPVLLAAHPRAAPPSTNSRKTLSSSSGPIPSSPAQKMLIDEAEKKIPPGPRRETNILEVSLIAPPEGVVVAGRALARGLGLQTPASRTHTLGNPYLPAPPENRTRSLQRGVCSSPKREATDWWLDPDQGTPSAPKG